VVTAHTLIPGRASGPALVLSEPLSFWGGVDAETGELIDSHHPERGRQLRGTMLLLPGGRGSSSSSSVLAECIRNGTAPAALLLGATDPILALGSLVAQELYGAGIPVVVLAEAAWRACSSAVQLHLDARSDGARITVVL
jgi:predicted aconitase with swiveling domain